MMKWLFRSVFLILLLAIPLSTCAGAAGSYAQPAYITYRVAIPDAAAGTLQVSLELEAVSQSLTLEIKDSYGDGLAVDLASHIRNETAVDASGKSLALERKGNTWRIDGAGGITFSYDIDVSGYEAGTAYLNSLAESSPCWPYFPLLQYDLAYLPGFAVFIYPVKAGDYQPRLELELPPGWQEALPWKKQPGNMEELLQNPIMAGELAVVEEGSFMLALPSTSAAASGNGLAEYANKVQALIAERDRLLGGLEPPLGERTLVALLFRGDAKSDIDRYYPSKPFLNTIAIPAPPGNDILSDPTLEATARGLVSLALAGSINPAAEALWLEEGASIYLQDLLPYRAGLWGGRTFWDRFSRHYNAYREARSHFTGSLAESGSLAPDDGQASTVLLCGGASVCAFLDSELSGIGPLAAGLPELLAELARPGGSGASLENGDIRSTLEALSGRSWASFFDDYVEDEREIPASSFSSLNVARPEEASPPAESPNTSTAGWIALGVAVLVIFLIPFILEPYTMRPRKPGFLKKELEKMDDEEN